MNNSIILMSKVDYQRINSFIEKMKPIESDQLELELDRAQLVEASEMPSDVITMNSEIVYLDLDLEQEQKVKLVYTLKSDLEIHQVSILSPLGTALIGLKKGEEYSFLTRNGKKKSIRILDITFQPEAMERFDL
jgi:regulator of nucleoside diphosphate kinase